MYQPLSDSDSTSSIIKDLIRQELPLYVAWTPEQIDLGTGFRSDRIDSVAGPWVKNSPFESSLQKRIRITREIDGGVYTDKEVSSCSRSNASDHLSVQLGVSVGNSLASVGVSGRYDNSVREQRSDVKSSWNGTCRMGRVYLDGDLGLSTSAQKLLMRQNGLELFRESFGEYYVAGFELGADAGACYSVLEEFSSQAELLEVKMKVKILWMEAEATLAHKDQRQEYASNSMRFIAYNTLTQMEVSESIRPGEPLWIFQKRVAEHTSTLKRLHNDVLVALEQILPPEQNTFGLEDCRRLCMTGLVRTVILLPYATLKPLRVRKLAN